MTKAISREHPQPLYKQVKAHLLDALYNGQLQANAKLPSERELVDQLGVSRITVRQALRELVSEGHLKAQPGKGFYATGGTRQGYELELLRSFTETALAHGQVPGGRVLEAEIVEASPTVAEGLRLSGDRRVVSLRRLRLLDQVPVAIGHDWVPLAMAPDLAALDWTVPNRSLYAELRDRYGLVPYYGETILSADLASADDAALLRLELPAPVLTVSQIAYNATGQAINLTHTIHHPRAYPLRLDQGQARPASG